MKSLDGVADDWPIDYWALERFYDENDRMMGVSGLAGDPGVPPRNPPMPPIPLGKTGTRYARAMNRLGWHWWPSDTTIATTAYEAGRACINLGHCTPGCAQGAKASTDITYWPLAIRAGVELRTRCRVREITTNEHGMAAGAIYYDAEGREQFQPAEVVIVACNGVGTPRAAAELGLRRGFPTGSPTPPGLVGKNLMLHPWPIVSRAMSTTRWMAGARPSPRCGASSSTRPTPRAASCAATRCNSTAAPARRTRRSPAPRAGRLPWGRDHHRVYRELLDHRVGIGVACEDLPEEHNRVTLDPVLKDSHGIPAPRIDYTISDNTRRMMEHGIARAEEILTEAGATPALHASRTVLNSPGHLLGTARMGNDPERSVVNRLGPLP